MADSYFSTFPKVNYLGWLATNVTLRTAFIQKFRQMASVYYPYQLKDGDTADNIAAKYYGDSNFDWLVYFANDIIDPYTQWPKDQQLLEQYIIKKYGSLQQAQSTIVFYRKNPETDYVSVDGTSFSTSAPVDASGYYQSQNYTDIQVSVDTYAELGAEAVNYYPVYAYNYEIELNEQKRNIVLIDNTLANRIFLELKELMNG